MHFQKTLLLTCNLKQYLDGCRQVKYFCCFKTGEFVKNRAALFVIDMTSSYLLRGIKLIVDIKVRKAKQNAIKVSKPISVLTL